MLLFCDPEVKQDSSQQWQMIDAEEILDTTQWRKLLQKKATTCELQTIEWIFLNFSEW